MKKTLSLLLFCFLLATLFTLDASGAAKGKMSLSGSMTDLKHGDSVGLLVELNRNPGVKNLRCAVDFDPKVLKFVGVEPTKTLPGFSFDEKEDQIILRWKSDGDTTAMGELASISFRVKDDAIYGDSAVSLTVSEVLYDAVNAAGEAIPFDTSGVKFTLPCPHEEPAVTVEQVATFETEGILKETCPNCGNITVKPLLPSVKSDDGRVCVTFSAGEFADTDSVRVDVEYIYASEEAKSIRSLLGEGVLRAFRIRITKNGESYVPARDCTVSLLSDFTLPRSVTLYSLTEEGSTQPKFELAENTLHFDYDSTAFALVERTYTEPVIPTTTSKTTTTPSTTSVKITNEEQEHEIFLITVGCIVLFVCGTGMILILARRKRY